MKKILASIMMGSLIFCLSACNMPWQKKDTQKEVKREVIQADKVQGTMKDMTLKVGVSNDMAPFSYYDKEFEWNIWHSTDYVLFSKFSNEDSEIETKIKLIQLFLSNYEEYRSVQLDRIYKKMSKISEETKEIKDEQAAMSDF